MESEVELKGHKKKVLLALLRHPDESDKQIAKRLSIKSSNFSVVKNRLQRSGLFKVVPELNFARIPQARVIAFLCCKWTHPLNGSNLEAALDRLSGSGAYSVLVTPDFCVAVYYFKSLVESEKTRLELREKASEASLSKNHFVTQWLAFPASQIKVMTRFREVAEYFLTGKKSTSFKAVKHPRQPNVLPLKLSKNDERVLSVVYSFPGSRDSILAKKLGLSKSSFSTIKKSLIDAGILTLHKTVDPRCLPGIEAMGVVWLETKAPGSEELTQKIAADVIKHVPSSFAAYYSNNFLLGFSLFRNLEEAENARSYMSRQFTDKAKTLELQIVPLSFLRFKRPDAVVKHLFNIPSLEGNAQSPEKQIREFFEPKR